MSSYFTLELDTTGPTIQINAPSYTSRDVTDIITISGNEVLSNYQDIYVVDSSGNTHNVTFSFDGNDIFSGNVSFSGYPIGVATIFAQLQDEVGNPSNQASAHITIVDSTYYSLFKLTLSDKSVSPQMAISQRSAKVGELTGSKIMAVQDRQEVIAEQKRIVVVSDTN